MTAIEKYRPRKVAFNRLAKIAGWQVKVYTITHREAFAATEVLENAVARLSEWLEKSKRLNWPTYNAAFLIVHEGRDGVWSLINWWVDGGMLQSTTFHTRFDQPTEFVLLPKEGFMACVWELPVISFERAMWVEHILKKAEKPDFAAYLENFLSKEV